MAQKVIVPRLGQTMTEGIIARWLKNDGDRVEIGDDIYELEYDKSTATIQAKQSGILHQLMKQGDTVPIGEAVGVILESGETLEQAMNQDTHEVANAAKGGAYKPRYATPPVDIKRQEKGPDVHASPMIKRLAAEHGIELSELTPSKPGGRLTAADVESFLEKRNAALKNVSPDPAAIRQKASPIARKIAVDRGIDIHKVPAADGIRVNREDVLNYIASSEKISTGATDAFKPKESGREKLSGMRKIISERMSKSYFTYPTVTLTTDADMLELMNFRVKFNKGHENDGIKLTVTDMIVAAAARALREHGDINAAIDGNEIVYYEDINIGIAVALKNGLVVPVLKQADKLSLDELAEKTKRLITDTQQGTITADEMKGGTFTITNLGTMGIDSFNPIINFPESAILGVGRTVEKPVVINKEIVIRPKAVLSLTHDHRLIDGVPAAAFLKTIVRYIENPGLLDAEVK